MNKKKLTDKEKIDAIWEKFQINFAEFSRILDVKLDTIHSFAVSTSRKSSVSAIFCRVLTVVPVSPRSMRA